MRPLLLLLCIALCWSTDAKSHLLNMTQVKIEIDQHGQGSMTMAIDLTKALNGGEAYYAITQTNRLQQPIVFIDLLTQLTSASQLTINGQLVPSEFDRVEWPVAPKQDYLSGLAWPMTRFYFTFQLPPDFSGKTLRVAFTDDFKFEEPIAVNIHYAPNQFNVNRWLVRNQLSPAFSFSARPSITGLHRLDIEAWLNYIWQGMIHIVPFGWDHILFVLGVLLSVKTRRQLVLTITAFTVAHTTTLGLATYGAIVVSSHVIEPIIALSIVWVALEHLFYQPNAAWRFVCVFGFGLVHGLGFAEALNALGLPSSGFIGALVSFNLGVELAQLGVVAVTYCIVKASKRLSVAKSITPKSGAVTIAFMAFVLFIDRVNTML